MTDIKAIAPFLGLVAAIGWGFIYAVNERNYGYITVPTYLLIQAAACAGAAFFVAFLTQTQIDFKPLFTHPERAWIWAAAIAFIFAVSSLQLGIRHTSATYTALTEIAYVILTPLFAYFLFGAKQWNSTMLLGAIFMFIGLGLVIYDQMRKSGT